MEEYGILSLLPPLVAIVMALVTKQTIVSLLAGVFVGTTIIYGFNPLVAIPSMISDFFIPQIGNEWNAGMIVLITSCGGFVYMIKASGAALAFGDFISGKIKNRKSALLMAYFGAFAFVYTEPTLTLGSIMRPVTEKFNVSRAKLAYLCDVMGCPFASMSPITSYGVYATGLITTQYVALNISDNPWSTFIKTIPFNLYSLFGLLVLLYVIIANLDIGPMYEAEKRAIETGELIGPDDVPMVKEDDNEFDYLKEKNPALSTFFWTLGSLFSTLLAIIMWTGEVGTNGVLGAFMNSNITLAISTSFFVSAIVAGILGAKTGVIKFNEIIDKIVRGIVLNTEIPLILVLAWSIGSITGVMDLKGYLVAFVEASTLNPGLLPAFIFLVGALVAFATGSSWGVWGIMMPIAIPMAVEFDISIPLMVGAVISGGSFGDHCSPISDTTILASTAAGADHIEHVKTQLPYAVLVASCSFVGYIVGGVVSANLAIVVTAVLIIISLNVLNRYAKKKYGSLGDLVQTS